jgi:hypothetical protein
MSREAIARKVVGSFITLLWEDQAIDDAAYMEQMEKLGLLPHMVEAREKARMGVGPEPDITPEEVEEYQKRQGKSGRGMAIVRERVVDAPPAR